MIARLPAVLVASIALTACSDEVSGRDDQPAPLPSTVVTSPADPTDDTDYERELDEIDRVLDELDIEIGSDQEGSG